MKKSTFSSLLKRGLPLVFSIAASYAFAQTSKQIESIRKETKLTELSKLSKKVQSERLSPAALEKKAAELNIPFRGVFDDRIYELKGFDKFTKQPLYYTTYNSDAAAGTSTNLLNSTGGIFNLDGQGIILHEWDGGGVKLSHQEFAGRVYQRDSPTSVIEHATHVAGTMVASGVNPNAKGMAPKAELDAYDWTNDEIEMIEAAKNGALVSNHSYGYTGGFKWGNDSGNAGWHWLGPDEDTEFRGYGKYSAADQEWDMIVNNAPYYLPVKAAGNPRGDGPEPGGKHYVRINYKWVESTKVRQKNGGIDGFDCIMYGATAKNIMTVAAAQKLVNGYNTPSDVKAASFSAFGPTDDGRIKPDIAGIGVDILSTFPGSNDAYSSISGTSMASPNVSGTLGLLQQHYRDLNNGKFMKATTLKALALGTANDAGIKGPDYSFGWGLLNALRAAVTISTNDKYSLIQERTLANNAQEVIEFTASGSDPIVATIVWNDPVPTTTAEGTPLNDRTKTLVNDLDIKITEGGNTYAAWILDPNNPGAPATTGDNVVDNVEQVYIENPVAGAKYTLTISHKGTLKRNKIVDKKITLEDTSSQDYSLVVTGINNGVSTDLELTSLKIDANVLDYNTETPVKIVYKNKGVNTVNNAKLKYALTDLATNTVVTTGTMNLPVVDAGQENTASFNVDLSKGFVEYTVSAEIILAEDEVAANNKLSAKTFGIVANLTEMDSSHKFGFESEFEKYGWTSEDVDGDRRTWYKYNSTDFARTGKSFAVNFSNFAKGTNDWLYSNPLKLKAGGKYRVLLYTRKLRSNEEILNIAYGTKANHASMTNVIASDILATPEYVQYVYNFTPQTDGIFYVGFQNKAPAGKETYALFVDDVYFDQSNKAIVDFSASKTEVNSFETVTFTDASYTDADSPISTYKWTFVPNTVTYKNGTNENSKNPQVVLNTEGVYTVSLSATNSNGASINTKNDYITVKNTAVSADFSADYNEVYVGGRVSLANYSSGNPLPTSFKWEITPREGASFVNNTSEISINPVVEFSKIGSYSVKLTATGPQGTDTEEKIDNINVIKLNPVRDLKGSANLDTGEVTLTWERPYLTGIYQEGFEGSLKLSKLYDEDKDGEFWGLSAYSPFINNGKRSLASFSWSSAKGAYDVNNWVVTTKINKGGEMLSFWVKHEFREQFDVYLVNADKVAGTTPTLTEIKSGDKIYDYTGGKRAAYENIKIDITQYKDTDFFLAFQHKSRKADNGFYLALDDIEVGFENEITAYAKKAKITAKVEPIYTQDNREQLQAEKNGLSEMQNSKEEVFAPVVLENVVMSAPQPEITGYKVFRDNVNVSTITDKTIKTFKETLTAPKIYVYDVIADYSSGQSSDKESVTVDLTTLATVESQMDKGLAVYPNPSTGLFTIKAASQVKTLDAQVYDMSGKLVVKKSSNSNQLDLDLTANGKGVYVLVIVDNNGKKNSVKLMVK